MSKSKKKRETLEQRNAKALLNPKMTQQEKAKQQQAGQIFSKMAQVKATMYVKGRYK